MHPELQPIFVKAVGKMECILWHKIGACLMITALNWHAVKDTRADFSQHRGSNHLVLLSSDHPWWFQGAKLIVCCAQSISIRREVTLLTELKRVVQLFSVAKEGTVTTVTIQSPTFYMFFSLRMLLKQVGGVCGQGLFVYHCRAAYDTSCLWLWNGTTLFKGKKAMLAH